MLLLNYLSSSSPWLSLPLPPKPPFFSMLQMQNNPLSLHYPDWSSASCQTEGLVSLLWSLFTILIIIKRLHPSLLDFGWINWTNQPLCSERDQPWLCPCFLIIHTTKHNLKKKQIRSNALLKNAKLLLSKRCWSEALWNKLWFRGEKLWKKQRGFGGSLTSFDHGDHFSSLILSYLLFFIIHHQQLLSVP